MTSVLLTPFTVNDSYAITSHSVFVQGKQALDTLPPYIYYELIGDAKRFL